MAVVTGEGLQIWPGHAWRILVGVEGVGLGIVLALMGMRGVLVEAGNRSRLFRTAQQGRQRIKPMHAANGLAMVVFAGYMAASGGGTEEDLALMIWLLWLIVCGMVAIGQLYLLVNAWWIRKDLLVPTPRLRELVKPG